MARYNIMSGHFVVTGSYSTHASFEKPEGVASGTLESWFGLYSLAVWELDNSPSDS